MSYEFEIVHKRILKKCLPYNYLSNQVKFNGIIKLKSPQIDFFSFFCKTIISQQISDKVAKTIWLRFCNSLNKKNPCLSDFPQKKKLLSRLSEIRISNQKSNYICIMYDSIKKGNIDINKLKFLSDEKIKDKLLAFKGVGNWTCDIILIFFLLRKNIFPHQDLVIKKTTERICQIEGKEINFREIFSPYLSIFSLHLWKMAKRILQ